MKVSEILRRRVRHSGKGVNVAADVNAVVAATVDEPGQAVTVSSRQKIVQRGGRTSRTTTHEEERR